MKHHKISRSIKIAAFAGIMVAAICAGVWTSHFTGAQGNGGNQFHGAIYTSNFDGSNVNQNIYPDKPAVYLNGGPQNQNGPGLPDGTYYFQVTDPSGNVLLSTDPAVCRQLTVAAGRVSGRFVDPLCVFPNAPHMNGLFQPLNGSTPVQLVPFNDTPNNGGEYKVHLIRQTSQTSIATDGIRIIFSSNDSKTDNFKVERPADPCLGPNPPPECNPDQGVILSGRKFYDANANALNDDGQFVRGITIVIEWTDNAGSHTGTATTSSFGFWSFGPIPTGSTYRVYELLPCVDEDADLVCDAANYWVQTAPVADSQNFQGYAGTANGDVSGLLFGDVCFEPASGGYTLGYWSNKNGERVMNTGGPNGVDPTAYPTSTPAPGPNMAGDLAYLRNLNLKTSTGANFDPTTYAQFRAWLLGGNAVNMANMLSIQLSATSLDVRHRFLFDGQVVDARTLGLGFASIGSVRVAANNELNMVGGNVTFTGNPLRTDQEILKNFLDGVNNNRLPFASATPCSVYYPPPPTPTPVPTP